VISHVACFGEALWDIFELPGGNVSRTRYERVLGGAPANVAVGLARLGVRASLIAGLGRDAFGEALAEHLRKDGVDVRRLVWMKRRTGVTFVSRDANGQPSFLFYRHETADVSVTEADITLAMADAPWVHLGSSTMMTPDLAAATRLFVAHATAKQAGIFFDLNLRPHLWATPRAMVTAVEALASHASVIKASADDLKALGTEGKALALLRSCAPEATLIVTRGEGIAVAMGGFGEVALAARRSRCVDATGAGDAFIAGALAVLVKHKARPKGPIWESRALWERALDVGHRMGQKAVSRVGAVTGLVRLDAIRNRVDAQLP
jgi:fructokinase